MILDRDVLASFTGPFFHHCNQSALAPTSMTGAQQVNHVRQARNQIHLCVIAVLCQIGFLPQHKCQRAILEPESGWTALDTYPCCFTHSFSCQCKRTRPNQRRLVFEHAIFLQHLFCVVLGQEGNIWAALSDLAKPAGGVVSTRNLCARGRYLRIPLHEVQSRRHCDFETKLVEDNAFHPHDFVRRVCSVRNVHKIVDFRSIDFLVF